jgi:hypothetical protein
VEASLSQVATEEECVPGGWFFDDPTDPSHILACPETCEAMQDDAEGRIDVVFGCEIVQGCAASGASSLGAVDSDVFDGVAGAPSTAEAIGCQWPLPEPEGGTLLDLDGVNVRYVTSRGFGVLLGQVQSSADCDSATLGWYYDDLLDPTMIMACPDTCDTLNAASVAKVDALFGCETKLADVVK